MGDPNINNDGINVRERVMQEGIASLSYITRLSNKGISHLFLRSLLMFQSYFLRTPNHK